MKGNAKKVAVFVSVAAIAIFIAVPMASAYDYPNYWWRILVRGEYAFTGSGACTLAPGGFNEKFVPNLPTYAGMGPNFWAGVYTFNYDGTGKMDAHQVYQEGPPTYSAGAANLSWGFTYEMDGAEITFTFIPGTYYLQYTEGPNAPLINVVPPNTVVFDKPWTGHISPDGRTLFVFYGVPMKLIIPEGVLFPGAPMIEGICNGVHQGFKTHY